MELKIDPEAVNKLVADAVQRRLGPQQDRHHHAQRGRERRLLHAQAAQQHRYQQGDLAGQPRVFT